MSSPWVIRWEHQNDTPRMSRNHSTASSVTVARLFPPSRLLPHGHADDHSHNRSRSPHLPTNTSCCLSARDSGHRTCCTQLPPVAVVQTPNTPIATCATYASDAPGESQFSCDRPATSAACKQQRHVVMPVRTVVRSEHRGCLNSSGWRSDYVATVHVETTVLYCTEYRVHPDVDDEVEL